MRIPGHTTELGKMAKRQQIGEPPTVTKHLKTDDKQLICCICTGDYRNPRYLPTCGHTFCENCLLTYTQNVRQDSQGSTFGCPVCRKPNNLPEHDEVTLQWVQSFPLNTAVINLMPQSSEEHGLCQPCKKEGKTRTGLNFCLDCKEILCKTCTKYHNNFKISENHKLIDFRLIATEKSRVDFFTDVGKCAEHPERDIEIYCKTHDTVVCLLCSSFQHKTCEISEIVGNDIDMNKLSKDAEVLMSQMIAAMEHLNRIQNLRMETKNNLKLKLKEIRENIEKVRDHVVELVDNVLSHIRAVTKQIWLDKEDGIDADMSKVSKLKRITDEKVALLDTIGQHGSEKHKFAAWHHINKEFEETTKQISEEDRSVKQVDVKLTLDDNLQKLIESTDVEKLVQIQATESESNHTPFVPESTPPRDTSAVSDVLSDNKLVIAEDHTVSPDQGRLPWYYGIAMCKDGRVILSDYRNAEKKYLCLYNPEKKTMQKLRVMARVFSAVQIDDTHLAFSSPDNKTISIVTVGNTMKVNKTFQTKYTPRSIVTLNNGQLAVAWNNPPAFGVIDISGAELVQKSYLDQDKDGRKFQYFLYLAVDERRQHVIQPCTMDKAVYCFDFEGKPVFKYTRPELTDPRGVTLDNCGNIYVCEYNSPSSIHKLSPTGVPISVITEGVPSLPLAICSDVTVTGFWITRDSPPRDKVVYFRLEQSAASLTDIPVVV